MVVKVLNQEYKLDKELTGYELLTSVVKPNNIKDIIAYTLNGEMKDLVRPIKDGAVIEFITKQDARASAILNYTTALVLGHTLTVLYPGITIALGNTNQDGFYLDFDYEKNLNQEDLTKITVAMTSLIKENPPLNRINQKQDDALKTFSHNKYAQDYILLNTKHGTKCHYEIKTTKITASGVAANLISGLENFKLLSVTGAYWMNSDKNKQLQRINGLVALTKETLNAKIEELNNRKNYDHRVLGKKLQIFTFNDDIGKGLPIFLPNGMTIKKTLQEYLRAKEFAHDYLEVATPVLGSVELYKKSGHWDHYRENMFTPFIKDAEQLVLRPMTCPHHCMIYQETPKSYRELPLRLSEHALLYRYESSGALTGLERVRSMELTDSHIFVRNDQIKSEFKRCYQLIDEVLKTLNITIDYLSLSLRDKNDKEKYYNDDAMWNNAEQALREVLEELQLPYKEMVGEAAFYGPKFDIQIKTPLGHEITISTIQFDFLLPQKFNLTYIDENNEQVRPVIIHRGLIGTYERFIATLLEQTQGVFPIWLAPTQVAILPINNSEMVMNSSYELSNQLKHNLVRGKIFADGTLGKRIRQVHEDKIPFIVVIGQKEVENKQISYHTYQEQKKELKTTNQEFITKVQELISNKS